MSDDKSTYQQYLDRKDQSSSSFEPCRNLARIKVGEDLMVNWFPKGEMRRGTVIGIDKGKPVVRLHHSGGILTIVDRSQCSWRREAHPKK